MNLKIVLIVALTILLVACPSKDEDVYIDLNSFSIEASCSNHKDNSKDTINCEDVLKVYLNFSSSPVSQTVYSFPNIGVANAVYEPIIYLQNKIVKSNIINTAEFNNLPVNSVINDYFKLSIDNSNWIHDLSMVEAVNEIVELQYKSDVRAYLKINAISNLTYTGRIVVQLELSDGTVLTDTTKNISIILK